MHQPTCLESSQLAFILADGKSRKQAEKKYSFICSFIQGQAQQGSELSCRAQIRVGTSGMANPQVLMAGKGRGAGSAQWRVNWGCSLTPDKQEHGFVGHSSDAGG